MGVSAAWYGAASCRYVFRVWGPLLPLAAFALRLLAGLARLPPSPPTAAGRPTPLRPGVTLAMRALVLYVAVAAVRVAVYLGHVAVQRQAELFLMSDHLLLAASMVSCLQVGVGLNQPDKSGAQELGGSVGTALRGAVCKCNNLRARQVSEERNAWLGVASSTCNCPGPQTQIMQWASCGVV